MDTGSPVFKDLTAVGYERNAVVWRLERVNALRSLAGMLHPPVSPTAAPS
jgi:hypothetical protein